MEEVVKLFSDHGTLVQPDALDYIMSKDDPIAFASHILSKMRESVSYTHLTLPTILLV